MLSRVSPGLQSHEDMHDEFKMMFVHYLNHKEIMVRKLSAKSLVSFTAKECLLSTLRMLHDLVLANFKANNFVHGCLLAMSYGVKLMKNEYPDLFQTSLTELMSLGKVKYLLLLVNFFSAARFSQALFSS